MKKIAIGALAVAGVAIIFAGCGGSKTGIPDTVATVNGQKISADDYIKALNNKAGRQVLGNVIEENILAQWAKDLKVAPTESQINKQIEVLKRDGIYEDQVEKMGEDALKSELTNLQNRINIAKKLYKPTDAELEQAYTMMRARYVHGPRKQIALVLTTDPKKIAEAAKALKSGTDFDEVALKYSDGQFTQNGVIKQWIDPTQAMMPKDLTKATESTKVGEVSKPFSFSMQNGPAYQAIIKVIADQPKIDKKLDDVKGEVADMYALQKSQMDPSFEKKFNAKKKSAKIEIAIPQYEQVANQFKNPPETMPMQMAPGAGRPSMRK